MYSGCMKHSLVRKGTELTTFIDVIKGDELPSEIQVLLPGHFETTKYPPFDILPSDIDQMVNNFNREGIRVGVPIDTEHDGGAANGWVTELINKGAEGLWAKIDWTKQGAQLLKDKVYRFFSPEFNLNQLDPETSRELGPVFLAGTLTNRPLFKSLNAIVGHETSNDLLLYVKRDNVKLSNHSITHKVMANELQDVRSKEVTALSDEDKATLREHKDELTADEQTKFAAALAETSAETKVEDKKEETTDESKATTDTTESTDSTEQKTEEQSTDSTAESVQASEKSVTISASELKVLKAQANAGYKASQDLKRMNTREEVRTNLLLVKGNEHNGKIHAAAESDLIELVMSFSEKQKGLFAKVMDRVPKATQLFSELGSSHAPVSSDALLSFNSKVDEAIKASEGKLSYVEAVKQVNRQNPELTKAIDQALESK